jgi:hypothetical protein
MYLDDIKAFRQSVCNSGLGQPQFGYFLLPHQVHRSWVALLMPGIEMKAVN